MTPRELHAYLVSLAVEAGADPAKAHERMAQAAQVWTFERGVTETPAKPSEVDEPRIGDAVAEPLAWAVGQAWRSPSGEYTWRVDSVDGDRAVLRSTTTEWATTRPLTLAEHNRHGVWTLVDPRTLHQRFTALPATERTWERLAHEAAK